MLPSNDIERELFDSYLLRCPSSCLVVMRGMTNGCSFFGADRRCYLSLVKLAIEWFQSFMDMAY